MRITDVRPNPAWVPYPRCVTISECWACGEPVEAIRAPWPGYVYIHGFCAGEFGKRTPYIEVLETDVYLYAHTKDQ